MLVEQQLPPHFRCVCASRNKKIVVKLSAMTILMKIFILTLEID